MACFNNNSCAHSVGVSMCAARVEKGATRANNSTYTHTRTYQDKEEKSPGGKELNHPWCPLLEDIKSLLITSSLSRSLSGVCVKSASHFIFSLVVRNNAKKKLFFSFYIIHNTATHAQPIMAMWACYIRI